VKSATAIALHKLDSVFTAAILKGHQSLLTVSTTAAEVLPPPPPAAAVVVDDPDHATST